MCVSPRPSRQWWLGEHILVHEPGLESCNIGTRDPVDQERGRHLIEICCSSDIHRQDLHEYAQPAPETILEHL